MTTQDFANFAVAWAGAGTAWAAAIISGRAAGADLAKVVAIGVSATPTGLVLDVRNVGGKGATDVQVTVGGTVVGYRGGLVAGEA